MNKTTKDNYCKCSYKERDMEDMGDGQFFCHTCQKEVIYEPDIDLAMDMYNDMLIDNEGEEGDKT